MAFHNVQLPDDIEKGAVGGPGFKTTVLVLASGKEKRNIDWSRSRGVWDISYGMDDKSAHEDVLAFFYARRGRAHSFRFKDWTDYHIGAVGAAQEIAIADGVATKFQSVRRYSSGGEDFDREITRIVAGSYTVYANAIEIVEGAGAAEFQIDIESGIITFGTAPLITEVVALIAEFDVPVRFEQDNLQLRAERDDLYDIQAINILEMKETLGSLV